MLEPTNPDIDVDALMTRVQHEVLRRQYGTPTESAGLGTLDVSNLTALIAAAAAHGGPRSAWPGRLWFVPRPLQRLGLRAVGWLLRDQLACNAALVQALRETAAIATRLDASVHELETRVRALEDRG
ncbi:MAG: hypothetical protein ABR975_15550 [Vulcanimicrobiaceae bacterium]|jgi:hypothetical protein